ncbi:MAG: class I SAM-dependent methyltransferase [Candidatus Omnitrophica bacterium]|nr:class I SAM-dependent methyltransferase [Candidatus Omnitrophota bacterium]
MKPSKFHNNRGYLNWLVYDTIDKFLEKYSKYFKGHLYDLGCGEAHYKEYFLQFADSYTGVDWEKSLHDSKADIISDFNIRIAIDNEVADTIVSISVLEHLYKPQVFLNESYRILKQGGAIMLQVP